MLYLHDIWVNWFESEENGYNVCAYHEWRKDDSPELLDQVPLLKVETELFDYIENNLDELPKELLEDVKNKAYERKNHENIQKEYCFVITDGVSILAVDTKGYTFPMSKSRLIPRHEQLVYEIVRDVDATKYQFEKLEKDYHILSPAPRTMIGLTRKERQLKQLLLMAIDHLHTKGNKSEVLYWYSELNPKDYEYAKSLSFEDIWEKLKEFSLIGWTKDHLAICEKVIKGQPFFEKLWEMEHNYTK